MAARPLGWGSMAVICDRGDWVLDVGAISAARWSEERHTQATRLDRIRHSGALLHWLEVKCGDKTKRSGSPLQG